jgi:EF hand domain-containing protein
MVENGGHEMRIMLLTVIGLALIVTATPTMAQKKSGVYPWERKGEQLRRDARRDPTAKIRARDEKGLKRLGLPPNVKLPRSTGPATQPSAPVGLDRYANLDADRDGFISRQEYLSGRFRASRAGPSGDSKRRRYQSKLDSRFRAADRNRDGRVSAEEIGALRNPRF